ncbi:MAG: ABC transporter substrate-binding protein, partial [Paracoccaceae bacterium]|nr:ABC transporter substrate-binding protein [Paracoccaceae bacterium]
CHPIRFNDLAARKAIPQALMDALPPAEGYAKAVFPTLDEQAANKTSVVGGWDSVVGANVK